MRAWLRTASRGALHGTEHELLETLSAPVCAVCERARGASGHYLAGVLREGVNDVAVRREWRRRGGLCARHWGVFRKLESPPLPAAILSEDLLEARLTATDRQPVDCPACEIERDAERRYLAALGGIEASRVGAALAGGAGFVCVRHLELLPGNEVRGLLEERLRRLLAEVREFRRRQDYRFAAEPVGDERDSWLRAIRALGGDV